MAKRNIIQRALAALSYRFGYCPIAHYHVNDRTCRAGGYGMEPGSQNGPHYHEGSTTCHAGDLEPGYNQLAFLNYCVRPHHHVGDPTWRSGGARTNVVLARRFGFGG